MNHAEKVKSLVAEYGSAKALFPCAEHERMALHAAIDEMQAEIDRLKDFAINELASGGVLVRLGRIEEYEGVCDELVFVDAMAGCTWPDYELVTRKGET